MRQPSVKPLGPECVDDSRIGAGVLGTAPSPADDTRTPRPDEPMSDFIREVDEDYRRERAINFLKRYQVPLAALVVLIVIGAGGWRWYVDRQASTAAGADARFQQAQTLAQDGQAAQAEAAFKVLAANGPAGYAELARLRAAEVLGIADPEAAAKQLDAIASDEGQGAQALRDLARYRGAVLRVGAAEPKSFDAQYGRFALDSFTFHNGMRELLALAALRRGDRAAATKYLEDIAIDPLAPPGLRNRAQAFRELVNAGPATMIPSPPGPAAVTPLAGGTAPAETAPVETLPPQFEPIAPVSRMPQSAMPPSEPEPEAPAASAVDSRATSAATAQPEAAPVAPAPVAPATPAPSTFPPAEAVIPVPAAVAPAPSPAASASAPPPPAPTEAAPSAGPIPAAPAPPPAEPPK